MKTLLDALIANLQAERQAMIADNVETMLSLVKEQEALLESLNSELAKHPELSNDERVKLASIRELCETNQLLAQQSLVFSRKILKALCEDEGYTETGMQKARPASSLDIRA